MENMILEWLKPVHEWWLTLSPGGRLAFTLAGIVVFGGISGLVYKFTPKIVRKTIRRIDDFKDSI